MPMGRMSAKHATLLASTVLLPVATDALLAQGVTIEL
jgi:hypothetical protein